jgi:hypothetical protein
MNNTICINPRYLVDFYKLLAAYTFRFTVSDMRDESVYIDFETDKPFNPYEFARDVRDANFLRKYDTFDITIPDGDDYKYFTVAGYNAYHDDWVTLIDMWDL